MIFSLSWGLRAVHFDLRIMNTIFQGLGISVAPGKLSTIFVSDAILLSEKIDVGPPAAIPSSGESHSLI